MEWQRYQLKDRAKKALSRSYWSCVLVAFILAIVGGSYSGNGGNFSSVSNSNRHNQKKNEASQRDYSMGKQDAIAYEAVGAISDTKPVALSQDAAFGAFLAGIMTVVIVIIAVGVVVGLVIKIFAYNPLIVGGYRYFVENAKGESKLSNLGYGFTGGRYKKVIKTMFLKDLFSTLWFLCFIIPGVIKYYEYLMIPYLLASDCDLTTEEIFAKTKEMTNGEKWRIFVLLFTFIGWEILGVITLGLVSIFFVSPYMQATMAELFLVLGGKDDEYLSRSTGLSYYQYELNAPVGGYSKSVY